MYTAIRRFIATILLFGLVIDPQLAVSLYAESQTAVVATGGHHRHFLQAALIPREPTFAKSPNRTKRSPAINLSKRAGAEFRSLFYQALPMTPRTTLSRRIAGRWLWSSMLAITFVVTTLTHMASTGVARAQTMFFNPLQENHFTMQATPSQQENPLATAFPAAVIRQDAKGLPRKAKAAVERFLEEIKEFRGEREEVQAYGDQAIERLNRSLILNGYFQEPLIDSSEPDKPGYRMVFFKIGKPKDALWRLLKGKKKDFTAVIYPATVIGSAKELFLNQAEEWALPVRGVPHAAAWVTDVIQKQVDALYAIVNNPKEGQALAAAYLKVDDPSTMEILHFYFGGKSKKEITALLTGSLAIHEPFHLWLQDSRQGKPIEPDDAPREEAIVHRANVGLSSIFYFELLLRAGGKLAFDRAVFEPLAYDAIKHPDPKVQETARAVTERYKRMSVSLYLPMPPRLLMRFVAALWASEKEKLESGAKPQMQKGLIEDSQTGFENDLPDVFRIIDPPMKRSPLSLPFRTYWMEPPNARRRHAASS